MSMPQEKETPFADRVELATRQNAHLCYQCKRCSSGCPVADHFDLLPSDVMLAIQNGDESVMRSRTVWLCASCQTCSTRCPQGLDIPAILDYFRQQTLKNASVPEAARFFATFMRNARFFGRVYEAGLMGELNLREGKPLRDVGMGLGMIRRGKIRLAPSFARPPAKVPRLETAPGAYAYYPGCSLHSTGAAFDRSFKAVAEELGGKMNEIPGWVCCGTTPAHGVDPVAAVAMPLKNLAIAGKMGMKGVVSPCASCYGRFKAAVHHYRHDGNIADKTDEALGEPYADGVEILNALDWLETIDSAAIIQRVQKPLKKLRVACYYGCLLTRPPEMTGAKDVENPMTMERVVRLLGARPVDWNRKTDCCGGSLAVSNTEIAKEMTAAILADAEKADADLIAVACPLCQVNLDERQPEMKEKLGFTIPVVYLTQLMAAAFGLPEKAKSLDQSAIPAAL